ncbi:HNH endonuclease [Ceratobasidium sp. AG-Ba]|nr:HNH endonuclease [Ceratobasidium sp. AG-Ba]
MLAVSQPSKVKSDAAYKTPRRHKTGSNTSAAAKEKLGHVATVPYRCLVTSCERPLHVCHVLARATPMTKIWQLERAWGLSPGRLNLDTTRNLIYLTPDMHQLFDRKDWALVPQLSWLRSLWMDISEGSSEVSFQDFSQQQIVDFIFLPLGEFPKAFLRFSGSAPPETCLFPFTDLPPIRSHIHPFFAICNVAEKEIHYRTLDQKNQTKPNEQRKAYQRALQNCINIYNEWLKPRIRAANTLSSSLLPPTHSSGSSNGHGTRHSKTQDAVRQHDTRSHRGQPQLSPPEASPAGGLVDSSREHSRVRYNRYRARSLPTPEYTSSEEDKPRLFGETGPPREEPPDVSEWLARVAAWTGPVDFADSTC